MLENRNTHFKIMKKIGGVLMEIESLLIHVGIENINNLIQDIENALTKK